MKKLILFILFLLSGFTIKAQESIAAEAARYIQERVNCCSIDKPKGFAITKEGLISFEDDMGVVIIDLLKLSQKDSVRGTFYGFDHINLVDVDNNEFWINIRGVRTGYKIYLKFSSKETAIIVAKKLAFIQSYAKQEEDKRKKQRYILEAQKGNGYYMIGLAEIYLNEGDKIKGMEWLEKSAAHESEPAVAALARFTLGDYFYHGTGVEKNYEKGMYWFKKSAVLGSNTALRKFVDYADNNHVEAIFMMGYILQNGLGVEKDYEGAKEWLDLAVAKNFEEAKIYYKEAQKSWPKELKSN